MAISFDAATKSGFSNSSGFTTAHTCTGTDRALVVIVMMGGATPSTQYTSLALTYNGVSMTSQVDITQTNRRVAVFTLLNPASGSNNVAATWGGGGTEIAVYIQSYAGVHQTSGVDGSGSNSQTGSGTSLSFSITTTVDNCWLVGGIFWRDLGGGTTTIDAGTERLVNTGDNPTSGDRSVTTAGSYALGWTATSNNGSGDAIAGVALAPSAASVNSNFLAFM